MVVHILATRCDSCKDKAPREVAPACGNRFQDHTGKQFGQLRVQHFIGRSKKSSWWCCLCACGTAHIVRGSVLARGTSKSCGCQRGAHGPHHYRWAGGRYLSSKGYVLIWMPNHPHAHASDNHIYEHRYVMEQKIGRYLRSTEIVHHKDGNKQNNHPDNLVLKFSNAEHALEHRKTPSTRRLPAEPNTPILCACGCGNTLLRFDAFGRSRQYIYHHHRRRNRDT